MSEACDNFTPFPQIMQNVRYTGGDPLSAAAVKQAITEAEARLDKTGRLVIRKSGTEPLIRVMAEGEDDALVRKCVADISAAVTSAAG